MHIYLTFMIFLLGLVLASFLNALLYRIDNGYKYPEIFVKGSHCEKCGKMLKVYELIPVLSYIIFRGRCSKCGYKIPKYYPVSELALGIGMGSIYYYSLPPTLYVVLIFFFCFSYFDRIYKEIPKELVDTFLIFSVIYFLMSTLLNHSIPENAVIGGIIMCVFILFIAKVMKKPFGMGDILVLLGLSIVVNLELYLGYIYVFLISSGLYSLYIVLFKKEKIKSSLALLPFMFLSLSITFLFYPYLLEFVSKVFYF